MEKFPREVTGHARGEAASSYPSRASVRRRDHAAATTTSAIATNAALDHSGAR